MGIYRRAVLAGTAYAAVLFFCTLVGSQSGSARDDGGRGPKPQEVIVVNSETRPVRTEVQGTVPVRTAPGSKVCIDPECNTVTLAVQRDQPIPVREVDDPARRRWVWRLQVETPSGEPSEYLLPVPQGTRWVIENVNFFMAHGYFSIDTAHFTGQETVFVPHIFRPRAEGGVSNDVQNHLTRIYSDAPHTRVVVQPGATLWLTLDGYLVPL